MSKYFKLAYKTTEELPASRIKTGQRKSPENTERNKLIKDLVGFRFGRLLVLEYVGSRPGPSRGKDRPKVQPFWKALCDCGYELEVEGRRLKTGQRKSCNTWECPFKDPGHIPVRNRASAIKEVWNSYKQGAKTRKLKWSLSIEQFEKLITSPCHYSGVKPTKRINIANDIFYWNGIDRLDSSKGYTPRNVVPCHHFANMAKGRADYKQFTNWLDQLVEYRNSLKETDTSQEPQCTL